MSLGSAVPCAEIMGTWYATPHANPPSIWYPIHLPVDVPISRVYRRPTAIVEIASPKTMIGAAWPVLEMLTAEPMIAIDTVRIRGKFRTPDMIGVTLLTLWK
jgi:hypothetical protein